MGKHKERDEDSHHGASRNSRKGTHRRKGSGGGGHKAKYGNSATPCCNFCYPEYATRMTNKLAVQNELKLLKF